MNEETCRCAYGALATQRLPEPGVSSGAVPAPCTGACLNARSSLQSSHEPEMSDEWLAKAWRAAEVVANTGHDAAHKARTRLRAFANRVLLVFATRADKAIEVPFSGRR